MTSTHPRKLYRSELARGLSKLKLDDAVADVGRRGCGGCAAASLAPALATDACKRCRGMDRAQCAVSVDITTQLVIRMTTTMTAVAADDIVTDDG